MPNDIKRPIEQRSKAQSEVDMNRRVSPKQLRNTVESLKRQIGKEETRAKRLAKLRAEIAALHDKLSTLKSS
jgi:hypothetical protein